MLKQKGYDVERIIRNCTEDDKFEDPKLGWCYRVDIKKIGYTHAQGTKNSDEYEGTDRPSSGSNDNIGTKMKNLLSTLAASGKENSATSKKRIGLVEKEKTSLNKLKGEIKMYKVPRYMNVDEYFSAMFLELDNLDHLDEAFEEKLAAYKETSLHVCKALRNFV